MSSYMNNVIWPQRKLHVPKAMIDPNIYIEYGDYENLFLIFNDVQSYI